MSNILELKQQDFIKLLESGILIALLMALLFFVNWCFFKAYYTRLGISPELIILPLDTSLSISMSAIVVGVVIIGAFFYSIIEGINKNDRFSIASSNYLVLFVAGQALWFTYISFSINSWILLDILYFIGSLSFFGYFLWFIYKKKEFKFLWDTEENGKLFVVILLISSLALTGFITGNIQATRTIQGELQGSNIVNFYLSNPNFSELKDKQLICISHFEEKYYVTPLEKNAPISPTIYVIPDNQVELVIMKRIT